MNIAEGQRLKTLEAKVESLERELKDAVRRLDDFSKADRLRMEWAAVSEPVQIASTKTLKLKKQA